MLYQNILDAIVEKSGQIFGEELTGIYLHGSMAMGCFHPLKSDIDLILVIREQITNWQKLQFMNYIVELNAAAPSKGIELSIVKEKDCREFHYPTPFALHFSSAHLQWFLDNPEDYIRNMNGVDKDLAAHFTIIKNYGIVLYGAEIDDVFADVPRNAYIDSIWSDIENAKEEIAKNPVYVILNLCRVAAFLKGDLIVSKKQGGEWALQNLSAQYHSLISRALQSYASGDDITIAHTEAQKFADEMLQLIKEMLHEHFSASTASTNIRTHKASRGSATSIT